MLPIPAQQWKRTSRIAFLTLTRLSSLLPEVHSPAPLFSDCCFSKEQCDDDCSRSRSGSATTTVLLFACTCLLSSSPHCEVHITFICLGKHVFHLNWTGVSCIAGRFFTNWAIREDHSIWQISQNCHFGLSHGRDQDLSWLLHIQRREPGPLVVSRIVNPHAQSPPCALHFCSDIYSWTQGWM